MVNGTLTRKAVDVIEKVLVKLFVVEARCAMYQRMADIP